jgi:hypothetical protein
MVDQDKPGTARRSFLQVSGLGAAAAVAAGVGGLAPAASAAPGGAVTAAATAAAAARMATASKPGKVPLDGADIRNTYINPINLSYMEVAKAPRPLAPTDELVADASGLPAILAKETWVAADGRSTVRAAKSGLQVLTENGYRTAADFSPVAVGDTVYVYASGNISGTPESKAVWSSKDYITWEHHEMNLGLTAPSVVSIGAKFYMVGNNSPVYIADTPIGPWTELGGIVKRDGTPLATGDMQFFLDTDGRLYLTYNIGAPIMGVELDANDPRKVLTDPVVMWNFDPTQEWEHFGDNKQHSTHGYVEASEMFKVGSTYYVSVASGGTEHTTYATGVMSSKSPLSGYTMQEANPIGQALSGSADYPNAGHGGFVVDKAGHLLFFYSYVIAYEQGFERRLGMDICTVEKDGTISCRLSNTPRLAPGREVGGKDDLGLYNVSTLTSAYWASSFSPGRTPYYAGDRSLTTWWQPAADDANPTYIMGFAGVFYISALQIHWKETGFDFTKNNAIRYTLEYRDIDSNTWKMLVDRSGNTTPYTAEYQVFDRTFTSAVRLRLLGTTEGTPVGIAQLNVFGENYTLAKQKGLFALTPPPVRPLKVDLSAKLTAVGSKPRITVAVTNNEAVPIDVAFNTDYGSKEFKKVQPGKSATVAFTAPRAVSAPAGEASVVVTAVIDGKTVTETKTVTYPALNS